MLLRALPLSGALVTTSPLAQPGQYSVVVSSPSGVTSAAQSLTVVNAPVIDSIDPPLVIVGAASFMLTVEGSGFQPGTVLKWNASVLPTTFLHSGSLLAQVSADLVAAAARVAVIAVKSGRHKFQFTDADCGKSSNHCLHQSVERRCRQSWIDAQRTG